jgi:streptogramin lyase
MNPRLVPFAVALASLACAIAGCSGSGSGNGTTPLPHPTLTPSPAPSSGSPPRSITFTIKFDKTRHAKSHARAGAVGRPKYISPNTNSVGVAVNGGTPVYSKVSCSDGECQASVTVDAPVNQTDTFDVTAWSGADGPGSGSTLLSEGSAQAFITPGGTLNIPVVLGGVVSQIVAVNLTNSSFTSGSDGSSTVTVSAKDPTGAVIVGCFASPVPVGIFENDDLQGYSFSNQGTLLTGHVLSSGSTADGCSPDGGSLSLYYRGALTGPAFPADAVVLADIPGTEETSFRFTYGDVNQYGLFYNHADDTTSAVSEIFSTCPAGNAGCAYYLPALAPFGADLTALAPAQSGEPGNPAVWGTDDYTGLTGSVSASGAFTLYPTDGEMIGPPHSANTQDANYSVPFDQGSAAFLIPVYNDSNLWSFNAEGKSPAFKAVQPQYTGAGFAFPLGAAPSVLTPDGSGNLWFVDPSTAAVDQSDAAGDTVVSCALPFSDGSTPVSGDALAVSGSTVWLSTVADPISEGQEAFVARFPTSIAKSQPCTVPFDDELPVPAEVDRIALDPSGNLWYVDNANTLGVFTPSGKTPVTQSLGFGLSSNLSAAGQYFYGIDAADNQLVRIDTSALPPKAGVTVAALPANWTDIQNQANDFNQVWIVPGPSGSLWFAGNVSSGLRAFTTIVFALNPGQLTFGPPNAHRHAGFGPVLRGSHRFVRPRGHARRFPNRVSLPNFGFR